MYDGRTIQAYSLLEVVLASAICATALVPALAFLRDGMALADAIDRRHLLLLYGISQMEEQLAVTAATWNEGSASGDFATDGHPNIRFIANRSDDAGSGGITDRLMSVSVTTYSDDDDDDSLDAAEMRTIVSTKIAKLVTYANKASN
jgi:hypothetical protein